MDSHYIGWSYPVGFCDLCSYEHSKQDMVMRIGNKKIEGSAGFLPKTLHILPNLVIHANRNTPKWQDWAVEIRWIVWAMGLRVKTI